MSTDFVVAEQPNADLAMIEDMVEALESHLLDNQVYRTITIERNGGQQPYKMSLGDLLSRLNRLLALRADLSKDEKTHVDNAVAQFETVQHELQSRYRSLLQREIAARLDALTWFLDECQNDRDRCRSEFPFEVRNRQRIQELLHALDDEMPGELTSRIDTVDARIRQMTEKADFVWQDRLQPIYPEDPYWYLYVLPPAE